jgi:AraC-like DNA-binding protein
MADRNPQKPRNSRSAAPLPRDLACALEWLRGHVHEPVRLAKLAEVAGVPARTLEAHFKQFLGTTPLGWVRQERLVRARRALIASDGRANVTNVALENGFSQLGRFSARYFRQFGELPSETLRRIKAAQPAAMNDVDDEAIRLTWRALPAAFAVAPKQCAAALEDLARAQELAPTYGLAKALAAWCWGQRAAQHFSATPNEDQARALRLAAAARALAPSDSMALTLVSGALTLAHRLDEADQLLESALAHDPWSPVAWLRHGWAAAYYGDPETAIRELRTTLHLMPFEPIRHVAFIGIGCAHFAAGRYERAARWIQTATEAFPGSFWAMRVAAAAMVHSGARAEGRRVVRQLLRKDPNLTVAVAEKAWPFPPNFMARLVDGLETAGLPRA